MRLKGVCRHGYTINIVCNWNVKGRCGIDAEFCGIVKYIKE